MRLEPGSCKGQSGTLIGGGPSLKGFDFNKLKGKSNIIALNAAFKYAPFADACFSEDFRFIEKFGAELQSFKGKVTWHCLRGIKAEAGLKACPNAHVIKEKRDDKYWSTDLDALSFSSNSAVGAINLLDILGCDPIYILGIDCRAEGMFLENFHQEYPQGWQVGSQQAQNFWSDFTYWVAPNVKAKIINVINPDFESSLDCWEKITLDEFVR